MQGDHSPVPDALTVSPEPKLFFPIEAPGFLLNSATVSLFNTAFFHKQMKKRVVSLQDYEPFFYPLDKVLYWNKLYGKGGLLQFQYVIPWEHAREGTIAVLREVAKSGLASFLAVLKAFRRCPLARHDELSRSPASRSRWISPSSRTRASRCLSALPT